MGIGGVTRQQMRGEPAAAEVAEVAEEIVQSPIRPVEDEPETNADDPIQWPSGVVEESDEIVTYTLTYPLEPTGVSKSGDPVGTDDVEKLRFRRTVYCRDIRVAGREAALSDRSFVLASLLCGVPTKILDRLDARDYSVVLDIVSIIGGYTPT